MPHKKGEFTWIVGYISHLMVDKPVTALIVVAALGYAGWFLFRYIALLSLQAWRLVCSRRRALQTVARVIDHWGPREGKGVWLTTPIERPRDYWRGVANSRTLAIANLKCGVGKHRSKRGRPEKPFILLDPAGARAARAVPGSSNELQTQAEDHASPT